MSAACPKGGSRPAMGPPGGFAEPAHTRTAASNVDKKVVGTSDGL